MSERVRRRRRQRKGDEQCVQWRGERRYAFANIEDEPVAASELRGVALDDERVLRREAEQRRAGECEQ